MRAKTAALFLALMGGAFAAETAQAPAFDFLDYLGSMVEQDGEWVDPVAMDFEADIDAATDDETTDELVVEGGEDE